MVLNFLDSDVIGRVTAVDTSRVLITVDDHSRMSHIGIGNLIAIRGAVSTEFLIGLVERITRSVRETLLAEGEDEEGLIPTGPVQDDAIRVVLIGTYKSVHGDKRSVFKRGTDSFPQIDRDCYLIIGPNLQGLMNMLSMGVPEEERLCLGTYTLDPDAVAIAQGDKFFQRHASILGSTGSGKSWTVALFLERASQLKYPNLIVLDMHGEYSPLTAAPNPIAQSFRIAGPGDLGSKEPEILYLPYWLLNHDEMLALLLDRSDNNAPNQAARFTKHVRELKEQALREAKKEDMLSTFTVDSPVPYSLQKLIDRLIEDNEEMVPGKTGPKQGEWHGKLTRFISRLRSKMEDRRNGFMFAPSIAAMEYEWLETTMLSMLDSHRPERCGIKIINFSDVPFDILPVVAGVFARLLYSVQFWMQPSARTPFTIVCDEAHLYLPVKNEADSVERRALEAFERIAKEGRKYGVSLLAVSQRPSDVSRTILSQCNNFVVMRLTNDEDQNVVKRLMPDSMAGLIDIIPHLDTGEALLLGDAVLLPSRIRLDKPRVRPDSGTKDFWTDWGNKQPNEGSIREAVETLRRQTRAKP